MQNRNKTSNNTNMDFNIISRLMKILENKIIGLLFIYSAHDNEHSMSILG